MARGLGPLCLGLAMLAAPAAAAPADACRACHGGDGPGPAAMPSLTAKSAETLKQELRDFRSGAREATIMDRIVRGYSDAELDAIIDSLTR